MTKVENLKSTQKKLTIAHSPDADDAFMFYGLSKKAVDSRGWDVEHVLKDIQTLNSEAKTLKYDVSAISFFSYPLIENEYQLLSCGGSVGYGYGPMIVSKNKYESITPELLRNHVIAVPGEKTTAFLLLKLFFKDFRPVFVSFDKIIEEVSKGTYEFGLIIHEGQLSYKKRGLHKFVDLGEWWLGKTNLPVPLGGNIIKRSFPEKEKKEINAFIRESILYGINNKKNVVSGVANYARELEDNLDDVSKFVSMYVNDFTIDYGVKGKLAIQKLFQLALEEGLIDKMPLLDFVE